MFAERVRTVLDKCQYKPGYSMIVKHDASQDEALMPALDVHLRKIEPRVYVQVIATIPDVITGEMSTQKGGKLYLSPHMTDTEIVRKVFSAYEAFDRHEIFEAFTYKGARVFGPHIDVEALVEISERVSVRS